MIFILLPAGLLFALATLLPLPAATITVTPSNLQGWTITPNGTVPYSFAPPASTGVGSLQFGPIDGSAPVNQFLMITPILDLAMASFISLQYDFYIAPGSIANSHQQLSAEVYIDQAANGIGAFAGGTGFYDCRYDYAPGSGTPGGWTSFGVALGTAFTGRANRTGICPATLGGLTASDRIRFLAVLGGGARRRTPGWRLASTTFRSPCPPG